LSIAEIYPSSKLKETRLRPIHREGLRIQYLLKDAQENFTSIGLRVGVSFQFVSLVVFGHRHSARVEAEIARILGKADWNEVVLEARSAITGKPVQAIIEEIQARREARTQAAREQLSQFVAGAVAAAKAGTGGAA
jgi:hypothetical protein